MGNQQKYTRVVYPMTEAFVKKGDSLYSHSAYKGTYTNDEIQEILKFFDTHNKMLEKSFERVD